MPVDANFEGRSYPLSRPYVVTRASVAAFAEAVGARSPLHHDVAAARDAGFADVVAPPTYAVVIAQEAEEQYVSDPAAGIDFARVVHAEERFRHARPLVAGDEISAVLSVERARTVGRMAIVTTRVQLLDAGNAEVAEVISTLVVRGEES